MNESFDIIKWLNFVKENSLLQGDTIIFNNMDIKMLLLMHDYTLSTENVAIHAIFLEERKYK